MMTKAWSDGRTQEVFFYLYIFKLLFKHMPWAAYFDIPGLFQQVIVQNV
jgi:hypothetical protein